MPFVSNFLTCTTQLLNIFVSNILTCVMRLRNAFCFKGLNLHNVIFNVCLRELLAECLWSANDDKNLAISAMGLIWCLLRGLWYQTTHRPSDWQKKHKNCTMSPHLTLTHCHMAKLVHRSTIPSTIPTHVTHQQCVSWPLAHNVIPNTSMSRPRAGSPY